MSMASLFVFLTRLFLRKVTILHVFAALLLAPSMNAVFASKSATWTNFPPRDPSCKLRSPGSSSLCSKNDATSCVSYGLIASWCINGTSELPGSYEKLRTQSGKLRRNHEDDMQSCTILDNSTSSNYVPLLRMCAKNKDLCRGTKLHEEIVANGLMRNCSNALATMYARCGVLVKAKELLMVYGSRDVFSWTALIAGFVQQGHNQDALDCFEHMKQEDLTPDAVTFACILKACGSLGADEKGKQIHYEIVQRGLLANDIVLATALVDMYVKVGNLKKAHVVLRELSFRDVYTWSSLILGYAQQGQAEQALNCFEQMEKEGLVPDAVTFACILKACGIIGATDMGKQIHNEVAKKGLLSNNIVLGTALVDMYAKCGALAKAQQVLEELVSRDIITWNALMAGLAQKGKSGQALDCLNKMQREGFYPNAVTFSCMLNALSNLGLVADGQIHFGIMNTLYSVEPDLEHYACMVDLTGRAGCLEEAVGIIQEMPFLVHSAVWSALLGACQKWGDSKVGRWAFKHALTANSSDGAAHVLMANIYAVASMQEDEIR